MKEAELTWALYFAGMKGIGANHSKIILFSHIYGYSYNLYIEWSLYVLKTLLSLYFELTLHKNCMITLFLHYVIEVD